MSDLVRRLQSEFIVLDKQREIRQEAATEIERLQAELAAHKGNEGDECPLCVLEERLELLEEYYETSEAAWNDVIDVWAADSAGRALHTRLARAVTALEEKS